MNFRELLNPIDLSIFNTMPKDRAALIDVYTNSVNITYNEGDIVRTVSYRIIHHIPFCTLSKLVNDEFTDFTLAMMAGAVDKNPWVLMFNPKDKWKITDESHGDYGFVGMWREGIKIRNIIVLQNDQIYGKEFWDLMETYSDDIVKCYEAYKYSEDVNRSLLDQLKNK